MLQMSKLGLKIKSYIKRKVWNYENSAIKSKFEIVIGLLKGWCGFFFFLVYFTIFNIFSVKCLLIMMTWELLIVFRFLEKFRQNGYVQMKIVKNFVS